MPGSQHGLADARSAPKKIRTSNIGHSTPNIEQKSGETSSRGALASAPRAAFLSAVQRWMFGVQCSMFAFPEERERCLSHSSRAPPFSVSSHPPAVLTFFHPDHHFSTTYQFKFNHTKIMSMMISDYDIEALLQFAIRHTATKVGIHNTDWKTPKELLDEIAGADIVAHELFTKFRDAYIEWYRYVKRLDDIGKHGNLDSIEKDKLFELIQDRDSTRSVLLAHLKLLP